MAEICNDNRFELIEKYKNKLLVATSIADSKEEMAVLYNILYRAWQMGWLEALEAIEQDVPKDVHIVTKDTKELVASISYVDGNVILADGYEVIQG